MEIVVVDIDGVARELKARGKKYAEETVKECAEAVNQGKLHSNVLVTLLLAVFAAGIPDDEVRGWLGLGKFDPGFLINEISV